MINLVLILTAKTNLASVYPARLIRHRRVPLEMSRPWTINHILTILYGPYNIIFSSFIFIILGANTMIEIRSLNRILSV